MRLEKIASLLECRLGFCPIHSCMASICGLEPKLFASFLQQLERKDLNDLKLSECNEVHHNLAGAQHHSVECVESVDGVKPLNDLSPEGVFHLSGSERRNKALGVAPVSLPSSQA